MRLGGMIITSTKWLSSKKILEFNEIPLKIAKYNSSHGIYLSYVLF